MLSNNHIVGELFECPVEFHGLLQPQFISWYPTENYNEEQLIPQVFSASENVESNQQVNKSILSFFITKNSFRMQQQVKEKKKKKNKNKKNYFRMIHSKIFFFDVLPNPHLVIQILLHPKQILMKFQLNPKHHHRHHHHYHQIKVVVWLVLVYA
jgi:hypothetical protein